MRTMHAGEVASCSTLRRASADLISNYTEWNLYMAKRAAKRARWTRSLLADLRRHSKARTPVARIAKQMKRTEGALRQQALKLGIGLGHCRELPRSIWLADSIRDSHSDFDGRRLGGGQSGLKSSP